MKKILLIITCIILVITIICLIIFYDQIIYNAKIYSQSEDLLLPEFLCANKVRGAFYLNPDYDPLDDKSNEYYRETDAPKNRTFIVDSEDTFNEIFKEDTLDINWDKEMVLLYIFPDENPYRKYHLKNISLSEGNLKIYYKLERSMRNDSTAPYQRCLIVKLNRQNIYNVEFIKK